ncbi:TonB-dependent receptor [Marichromatium gracile]|uniref:TonB-dependent receptor n=1 Tax=Marichromatium gracile TaxID=1048 RepID=UPI001F431638|nr:TonB-dependent receptor [Marichromatium gracile]MCF1182255.1 TonB-dependent receptor [Marichromatium gracile]
MIARRTDVFGACLLGGLWPAVATFAVADDEPVMVLEPLQVEARQWRESAQLVPQTVEVLDGRDRQGPLWRDFSDLATLSPNTQVQQSSVETRLVIRGATAINTGLQDPVGYFVNDVALPLGATQAPALFALERIEVVKGPQGTLYGRNTEAGAVRIETRDPEWAPSAEASLSLGMREGAEGWRTLGETTGRVSGALSSRAAVGLAARHAGGEGLHYNQFDGDDDGGARQRWTFSGGLALDLAATTSLSLKSVIERDDQGKRRLRYLTGPAATGRFVTDYDLPAWQDTSSAVHALRIDHDLATSTLSAITGWTDYGRDFQMDRDVSSLETPGTRLRQRDQALSQELRLSGGAADASDPWRWLVGLHAYRQWSDLTFGAGKPWVVRHTRIDQLGVAGFGQLDYRLSPAWRLGFGARLEHSSQDGRQVYREAATTRAYDARLDHGVLLPRLSLTYTPSQSLTLFGSLARGYLPGGYNYSMASDRDSLTYAPEYSWAAEIGAKSSLLDGRAALDLALFYTRTTDKQLLELLPGGATRIDNAAEARSYGLELGLRVRPAPAWTLFANLGLQRAETTRYRLGASDLSGNRLPLAAAYTYALGVRHDSGGDGVFAELRTRGSGPYYFDVRNQVRQDAALRVDAEIGYRWKDLSIALWGRNLFDEAVYERALAVPRGVLVEDGEPRTIGLRVGMAW